MLLLIDDYSRFIVGGAILDGEKVDAVREVFMNSVNPVTAALKKR